MNNKDQFLQFKQKLVLEAYKPNVSLPKLLQKLPESRKGIFLCCNNFAADILSKKEGISGILFKKDGIQCINLNNVLPQNIKGTMWEKFKLQQLQDLYDHVANRFCTYLIYVPETSITSITIDLIKEFQLLAYKIKNQVNYYESIKCTDQWIHGYPNLWNILEQLIYAKQVIKKDKGHEVITILYNVITTLEYAGFWELIFDTDVKVIQDYYIDKHHLKDFAINNSRYLITKSKQNLLPILK